MISRGLMLKNYPVSGSSSVGFVPYCRSSATKSVKSCRPVPVQNS